MNGSQYVAWSADGSSFSTTPAAYFEFVRGARLRPLVAAQLRRLREGADLVSVGTSIRTAYFRAEFPPALADALSMAYYRLGGDSVELLVGGEVIEEPAVELGMGLREVYAHVRGSHTLLWACKRCWASLFTEQAIVYRETRHLDQLWWSSRSVFAA